MYNQRLGGMEFTSLFHVRLSSLLNANSASLQTSPNKTDCSCRSGVLSPCESKLTCPATKLHHHVLVEFQTQPKILT